MTGEPIHSHIIEYMNRKRLSELGYSFSSEGLRSDKAESFLIISSAIDKFQADQMKKVKK